MWIKLYKMNKKLRPSLKATQTCVCVCITNIIITRMEWVLLSESFTYTFISSVCAEDVQNCILTYTMGYMLMICRHVAFQHRSPWIVCDEEWDTAGNTERSEEKIRHVHQKTDETASRVHAHLAPSGGQLLFLSGKVQVKSFGLTKKIFVGWLCLWSGKKPQNPSNVMRK